MKVLMLSEDVNISRRDSEAALRMQEYADVLGELHIVVSGKGNARSSTNIHIYPAQLRTLGVLLRGWKLCRTTTFDALTVQAADDIGLVGFFLARRFKIPFQLQLHTDVMSPWYRRGSWKERVRYWIAKFLIPRAGSIRAVSERIKNSIHAKNCVVLPIFTDVKKFFDARRDTEFDMRTKEYNFKMIAAGRFLEKEKNFLMLIDMMRDFVTLCPLALLTIVGDGPDKEIYELRIKNHGLQKNIILESWRLDMPCLYKSFDLFLLSSNYEGWGMAPLEAMASGLPVVMTDVGLAGEIVRDNESGRVVPVGDVAAMREAVKDLYKNPEKRKKFVKAGYAAVAGIRPNSKEEYLKRYKESFEILFQK